MAEVFGVLFPYAHQAQIALRYRVQCFKVPDTKQCTIRQAMKIKEIKGPKSQNLFHARFWTKTGESFFK